MKKVGITGHRPPRLWHGESSAYDAEHYKCLAKFAVSVLRWYRKTYGPDIEIWTGMALGWDQAMAVACIHEEIPFVAVVPFEGQERKWPPAAREHYKRLISQASKTIVTGRKGEATVAELMFQRDDVVRQAVNHSIALFDGEDTGGTAYYLRTNPPHVNVWNQWLKWRAKCEESV